MIKNLEGCIIGSTEPDIVILGGQTCKEVKDILKKYNDPVTEKIDTLKCKTLDEFDNLSKTFKPIFEEETTVAKEKIKDGEPTLIFEDMPVCNEQINRKSKKTRVEDDCFGSDYRVLAGLEAADKEEIKHKEETFKNLRKSRLIGDFDQFHSWRKAAGLINDADEWLEGALNPSKELMEFITLRIKASFPKLEVEWTTSTWNPRLILNGMATQVCLERIAISYKGLLHITDEINAQSVIANIVLKKLKELFI